MRIIFLRSNPVDPDPRVEKEVNSLVKAGYKAEILAWDRSSKYSTKESYSKLEAAMWRYIKSVFQLLVAVEFWQIIGGDYFFWNRGLPPIALVVQLKYY